MSDSHDYPHGEILASVSWLGHHLQDSNLRLLDARGQKAFAAGHIPGAIPVEADIFKVAGSGEPVSAEEFARDVGALGIRTTDTVICYDADGPLAARAWWAFARFGHRDVRFLNGGLGQWTSAGFPLSTEPPKVTSATYALGEVHDEIACSLPQAVAAFGQTDVLFWDTRTEEEYTGAVARFNPPPRPGHIPGAVRLEWNELTDLSTGLLKPADEMRQILTAHGITADKNVYTY